MPVRGIRLPQDLNRLAALVENTIHYAHAEDWQTQVEEAQILAASYRNYAMVWPFLRLLRVLIPSLRHMVQGAVWEEEGELLAFGAARRVGGSDAWRLSGVGVLRERRRQGLGSAVLRATLDAVKACAGAVLVIDILQANLPAAALLASLGFDRYSGGVDFLRKDVTEVVDPAPDPRFEIRSLGAFDWRPRYELEQRIAPISLQRYEPVDVRRFRKSWLLRLMRPLVQLRGGARDAGYLLLERETGTAIAEGRVFARGRSGEHSEIIARLDPDRPEAAGYLLQYLVHAAQRLRPGAPVEFSVPSWMEALGQAAEQHGFEAQRSLYRFGKRLRSD